MQDRRDTVGLTATAVMVHLFETWRIPDRAV